ncbi:MAG: VWA domain-containing protein [Pyrinomonadaceae bacterium]
MRNVRADRHFKMVLVLFLSALFAAVSLAQTPTPTASPTPDDEPIKVDTLLINIPMIVTDRDGRYVGGLKKDDFSIELDGVKQEIEYFADAEAPVSVAIILDMSGSTLPYIKAIRDAAKAFVDKLNPADQAVVMTFDQRSTINVECELTSDRKKLSGKIGSLRHSFRDPMVERGVGVYPDMYDTIYKAIKKEFASVKGRKAIIVLTDGFIVGQTVKPKVFDDTIIEGDTVIYPVMFVTRQHLGRDKTSITTDELYKQPSTDALNKIAIKTGGRLILAGKDVDFNSAFQAVGDELRKQYILGFVPSNVEDLKAGRIALGVNKPGMKVRSKSVIRVRRSH